MKQVLCTLIRGYQVVISPLLGPRCRFYPSCSEYSRICLQRYTLDVALKRTVASIIEEQLVVDYIGPKPLPDSATWLVLTPRQGGLNVGVMRPRCKQHCSVSHNIVSLQKFQVNYPQGIPAISALEFTGDLLL